MKNIEVEIRGFLTENKYRNLGKYLDENAKSKTIDDRETVFFMIPGATLKIARQLQKNTAKIALKTGQISKGGQKEYEIEIKPDAFEEAVDLFKELGFKDIQRTSQKRVDYKYRNWCEISLKWSKDWGYHFEIEKVISKNELMGKTRKKLMEIAKELGLNVISEDEFMEFAAKVDEKYRLQGGK